MLHLSITNILQLLWVTRIDGKKIILHIQRRNADKLHSQPCYTVNVEAVPCSYTVSVEALLWSYTVNVEALPCSYSQRRSVAMLIHSQRKALPCSYTVSVEALPCCYTVSAEAFCNNSYVIGNKMADKCITDNSHLPTE